MAASWKKRVGRFTVNSRGSRLWLYCRQGTTGTDRVTAKDGQYRIIRGEPRPPQTGRAIDLSVVPLSDVLRGSR